MSKQIYEEALADAKQIMAIAEDHAKRAVIDEVTPHIRELIDRHVMCENFEDEEVNESKPSLDDVDEVDAPLTTMNHGASGEASGAMYGSEPSPVTVPPSDEEDSQEEGVFELSLESVENLMPVFKATNEAVDKEFELSLYKLGDKISLLKNVVAINKNSRPLEGKINEMIEKIENMYEYVKENNSSLRSKKLFESKLESYFKELNEIREKIMKKTRLSEADVSFKVTGLSDSASDALRGALSGDDSENIGIDIEVSDDETETPIDSGTDDLEFGGEEPAGDEIEMSDDSDTETDGGEEEMNEVSDDTVVELDENMLRNELKKMRTLREEKWPSEIIDDFGGGTDENDPWLDGEVTTEAEEDEEEDEACKAETFKRRISHEQRLIAALNNKLSAIKVEAKKSMSSSRKAQLREVWENVSQRLEGAKKREQKYTQLLKTEVKKSARTLQNEGSRESVESTKVTELQKKLSASNLYNAKLTYTNKLLQAEGLTPKQKTQIIESLDEARSLREVKLLYENLAKNLSQSKQVNESAERRVIGSGSRVTKPGSAPLNESNEGVGEAERWARLAGINSK